MSHESASRLYDDTGVASVKDTQSLLLVIAGIAVGFALGQAFEHNRLLTEMKDTIAQHREEKEPA